jgi:CIC family chloride channel protein
MFLKIKIPNYFKPAIAGFIVGLVGLFIPFILGSGNIAVDFLLMHKFQIGLICLIFLLKLFLTPLCFGSGAAGGIFLPTLMLGAFLGYIIASLLNFCGIQVDYILMSVLGMGAFLAAVARTPITAAVMVFEMTGSYNFILPIMLCAAIADLTAEKLGHKPIYSMLIVQDMLNSSNMNDLAEVKVKNIMIREVSNFQIKDTIIDVKNKFNNTEYEIYPVLNKKKLCGYITKANFEDLLFQNVLTSIEIEKYMNPNPITITENENLYIAYYKLHSNDINCLFVVDKFNNLKGILTREDIMSCPAFINKLK